MNTCTISHYFHVIGKSYVTDKVVINEGFKHNLRFYLFIIAENVGFIKSSTGYSHFFSFNVKDAVICYLALEIYKKSCYFKDMCSNSF